MPTTPFFSSSRTGGCVFDMAPWLETRPFQPPKDLSLLARASVGQGTVVWPGDLDIAPETLYDRGRPPV